jgi:hypothetical protein
MLINKNLSELLPSGVFSTSKENEVVRIELPVSGLSGEQIAVFCELSNGLLTFHDNAETISAIEEFGFDAIDIEDVDPLCIDAQKSSNNRVYVHALSDKKEDINAAFFNFAMTLVMLNHLYGNEIYEEDEDDS